MLNNIIKKLKNFLNDLDYLNWEYRIMSDAIEFGEDSEFVSACLNANYKNHYGKGDKEKIE